MALFRPATKSASRLRLALTGPPKTGKTYSSLKIGTELLTAFSEIGGHNSGRIAVIDTERGSASKYAHMFKFDVLELSLFHPLNYIESIKAAENEGYDLLIIDSLSHAWFGAGGELEMVDRATAESNSRNSYFAWRSVTPLHNSLIEAILQSRCHIIATMRTKVEYALETNERGQVAPKKIGLAPIMREGMEYEFDACGDMDSAHNLRFTGTRCETIDNEVFPKPGRDFAKRLAVWLSDGAPIAEKFVATHPVPGGVDTPTGLPAGLITAEQIAELTGLITDTGMDEYQVRSALGKRGVTEVARLSEANAADLIGRLAKIAHDMRADRADAAVASAEVPPSVQAIGDELVGQLVEQSREADKADKADNGNNTDNADNLTIGDITRREATKPEPKRKRKDAATATTGTVATAN